MTVTAIQTQRIYDDSQKEGICILVDRIWLKGISKEDARLDYWLKEIAQTSALRKWFNHDSKLYVVFKEKYEKELRENKNQRQAFDKLKDTKILFYYMQQKMRNIIKQLYYKMFYNRTYIIEYLFNQFKRLTIPFNNV